MCVLCVLVWCGVQVDQKKKSGNAIYSVLPYQKISMYIIHVRVCKLHDIYIILNILELKLVLALALP